MNNPEIRYLQHEEIDFEKWDRCIANSINGIVYAGSWYLDRICNRWDALVYGDYLYVMPLVWNRKFGISYVYQPFFTQQLGVFSAFSVDKEMVNSFIHAIPGKFRLVEMNLNYQNIPGSGKISVKSNITYHLPLAYSIKTIREQYSDNTRRNLKKAGQQKLFAAPLYNIDEFIAFTKSNLQKKSPEIKTVHYQNLKRVISHALYHRLGELAGVFNSQNQLIAAVFFVWSNRKVIYLAASSLKEGTEKKAMFLLVDKFIESRAESELILDFEGSNMPGVARFYEGFGARPVSYFSIRRNTLPWYIRLLKK
ncbi:MAG: hypothetical protein A2W89_23830 [Bacteroidetes bacterium GWE2_42_39]|nr:MAG: hypothetical protein A2W89_23830 [Bacteroidetes bacterium GWE2_42_39]